MSVKGEALYALAAYRRLLRGLPGASIDDEALAAAEETIKDRPDPDVQQGAPTVQGGSSRDDTAKRMVRAARRTTKKRAKSRS